MKHTNHADYALRVLLYLRVAPDRRGSVAEIAAATESPETTWTKWSNGCRRRGWFGRRVDAQAASNWPATPPRSASAT